MAAKIKKGDQVVVLAGRDKGKKGEVIEVRPADDRVVVRGVNIVKRALEEPLRLIASNAGHEGAIVIGKVRYSAKVNYGFDANTEEYTDMIAAGILDQNGELVGDLVGRQERRAERLLDVRKLLVHRHVLHLGIAHRAFAQRGHLEVADLVAIEARPLLAEHRCCGLRRHVDH